MLGMTISATCSIRNDIIRTISMITNDHNLVGDVTRYDTCGIISMCTKDFREIGTYPLCSK
jgi:hypothetical protein